MSLNKVMLIGNLGQDPEVNTTGNGSTVANFSIATSERWKDKQSGEMKEEIEWTRVVAYGRQAEIVRDYLKKGSKVYVEGRKRTNKWQDKDGKDQYTTEVLLGPAGLQMLDTRSGQQGGQQAAPQPQAQQQQPAQQAPQQPQQQPQAQPAPQQQQPAQQAPQQPPQQPAPPQGDFDDDIPF